ncbi:hypothetical protein MMC13_003159 [Lambiella insularis]|nr:hypothetical protein [Lambiella insularis]
MSSSINFPSQKPKHSKGQSTKKDKKKQKRPPEHQKEKAPALPGPGTVPNQPLVPEAGASASDGRSGSSQQTRPSPSGRHTGPAAAAAPGPSNRRASTAADNEREQYHPSADPGSCDPATLLPLFLPSRPASPSGSGRSTSDLFVSVSFSTDSAENDWVMLPPRETLEDEGVLVDRERHIQYTATTPSPLSAVRCNCTYCQKLSTTNLHLPGPEAFTLLHPSSPASVASYLSRSGAMRRYFCATCGAHVWMQGEVAFEGTTVTVFSVNLATADQPQEGLELSEVAIQYWDGLTGEFGKGTRGGPWRGGLV